MADPVDTTPTTPATPAADPASTTADDLSSTGEVTGDFHLADFDDDEGDFLAAVTSEPAAATPSTPPVLAEAAPSSSAPSAPGQPEPAQLPTPPVAAQPQAPAETPPAAPAASSAPTAPGDLARSMIENREVLAQQLAQELYANVVPKEDLAAAGFDETAAAVISRVAAQVHLNVSALLYQTLASQVPRMMEVGVPRILDNQRMRSDFFDKFDKMWPNVKRSDPNVDKVMRRIVSQYGPANPQVPVEQAVKEIGGLVSLALGLAVQPAVPTPAAAAAPVHRPAAAPGNVVGAFQPAPGGVPSLPQPPANSDPWAGLGGDFED